MYNPFRGTHLFPILSERKYQQIRRGSWYRGLISDGLGQTKASEAETTEELRSSFRNEQSFSAEGAVHLIHRWFRGSFANISLLLVSSDRLHLCSGLTPYHNPTNYDLLKPFQNLLRKCKTKLLPFSMAWLTHPMTTVCDLAEKVCIPSLQSHGQIGRPVWHRNSWQTWYAEPITVSS